MKEVYKMGVRSEYQKHFKVSTLRKSLPIYYENVAFRTARREREYAHTPLSWNDEEGETDSVDTDSVEESQIKTDKADVKDTKDVNKSPTTKDSDLPVATKTHKVSNDLVEPDVQEADSQKPVDIDDHVDETCKEIQQEKGVKQKTPKGVNSKTIVIKPKQRRPDRKQKIPTRPTTKQTSSRPSSRQQPAIVSHPAPFISYGWGDIERNLCDHKTFNVRASTDVYPAALRAQSRRKTAAERRSALVQKSSEDKLKALMEAAAREKADHGFEWKSEYQQQFPAYDQSEYIRSASARSNERKLCRVVYVS